MFRRIYLKQILLTFFMAICLTLAFSYPKPTSMKPGFDYFQYYVSGKLLKEGKDPYNKNNQTDIQCSKREKGEYKFKDNTWQVLICPTLMYNPPLAQTFSLISGSLGTFDFAYKTWTFFSTLIMVLSCFVLLNILKGGGINIKILRIGVILFLCSFPQFIKTLYAGQISSILLLSLTLSIYFELKEKHFWSAFFLSFSTIKPHSLYLYYFIWFFQAKKYIPAKLSGFLTGIITLSLVPLYFKPDIYQLYLNNMISDSPSAIWLTATLGSWIQLLLSNMHASIPFIPTFITLIAAVFYLLKYKNISFENRLLFIIPLSLVTAPYGWSFEQLLLVPSFFILLDKFEKNYKSEPLSPLVSLYTLVIVNILYIYIFPLDHYFVFYPCLFLLIALKANSVYLKNKQVLRG